MELLAHVFDLQCLDRLPVQAEFASYILDRRGPAAPPHVEGEALGLEWVVGQPVQLLLLHGAAAPAGHVQDLELQVYPSVATGEIARVSDLPIVESSLHSPAAPTGCFFPRRRRRTSASWDLRRDHGQWVLEGTRESDTHRPPGDFFTSVNHANSITMRNSRKTLEKQGASSHQTCFSTHTLWRRAETTEKSPV